MSARRSYGTGSLTVREDKAGELTYYGHVRAAGRRAKRALGRVDQVSKREAEAALRELAAELAEAAPAAARLDVAELGARYLDLARRRGRKPSTLACVECELRVHLVPFFGATPIERIEREDVADLIATLLGKGLAPKSVRNIHATLTAMLNLAVRRGWIASAPCASDELPVIPECTEIRFLTPDELALMLGAVNDDLDRAVYLTAAMTGLRQGELRALRWADVDFASEKVRVRRGYWRGQVVAPKGRRARSVPMAPEVAAALDALSRRERFTGADDLVFTVSGGPVLAKTLRLHLRAALRTAGLDDGHVFHDLRHSFGTALAAAGVPVGTIQAWMGHQSLATTQVYMHYSPSAGEADRVTAAFARGDNVVPFASARGVPQSASTLAVTPGARGG